MVSQLPILYANGPYLKKRQRRVREFRHSGTFASASALRHRRCDIGGHLGVKFEHCHLRRQLINDIADLAVYAKARKSE